MQYIKSPILSYWLYPTSVSSLVSSSIYKKGIRAATFWFGGYIIIFLILIWNSHFFFLWHNQLYHHQGNLNMKRKNTTNGFSSGGLWGGQVRRIRYVYEIRWYDNNWFQNSTKSEAAGVGAKSYASTSFTITSSSSAAVVTRLLLKNNLNIGRGPIHTTQRGDIVMQQQLANKGDDDRQTLEEEVVVVVTTQEQVK